VHYLIMCLVLAPNNGVTPNNGVISCIMIFLLGGENIKIQDVTPSVCVDPKCVCPYCCTCKTVNYQIVFV
jgi:hypothetical protein